MYTTSKMFWFIKIIWMFLNKSLKLTKIAFI